MVDDEHDVRDVLARALERDGHAVVTACSISEARPAIQEGIELLVLDLGLPDGSGLELCRELRRDELSLPILILTAHAQVELRVEGLDAGALQSRTSRRRKHERTSVTPGRAARELELARAARSAQTAW